MELDDLRTQLRGMPEGPEAEGLAAFIELAEDLPDDVTIMGKIQRRFVDPETIERIRQADSLDEVQTAFGEGYRITVEEL